MVEVGHIVGRQMRQRRSRTARPSPRRGLGARDDEPESRGALHRVGGDLGGEVDGTVARAAAPTVFFVSAFSAWPMARSCRAEDLLRVPAELRAMSPRCAALRGGCSISATLRSSSGLPASFLR
ncbi:MAG: hypothetical protein U1F09_16505 [Steroidobacteraceae bacterium]